MVDVGGDLRFFLFGRVGEFAAEEGGVLDLRAFLFEGDKRFLSP